ncbi:MAG: hypothetical protein ACYC0X_12025 [Pirellulaceae bacterium]
MRAIIEKYSPILPFLTFAMIAGQLFITWGLVGWIHYNSQNRTLPKDSYRVELVTAADYAKLQDPSLQEVKLSNGTTICDRQPVWYETILPNYKRVDDRYVLITTVGTAHYYPRWMQDSLPLMLLAVVGILVAGWDLRRRYTKPAGLKGHNR